MFLFQQNLTKQVTLILSEIYVQKKNNNNNKNDIFHIKVGLREMRMLISSLPLVLTSTMSLRGRTQLNGKIMIEGAGPREKATS